MGTTQLIIYNRALTNIGITQLLTSTAGTDSVTALLNLHWTSSLETLLGDFPWGFATDPDVELTLITDQTDLGLKWLYKYAYPSTAVTIRHINTVNGLLEPNPPDFEIGYTATARVIYTDVEDAFCEITKRQTDPTVFPGFFADALAWMLSFNIAPGNTRMKVGDILSIANRILDMAKAQDGNQFSFQRPDVDSDAMRARQ